MRSSPDSLAAGFLVAARFRIESVLGSGPGYRNYLATEIATGERASLRLLAAEEFAPALDLARLNVVIGQLRGAAIPGVISEVCCGEDQGLLWVARRWIPALPLVDLLRAQKQLTPADAYALLGAIADACAAASAAGLPGLDLSPRPLLLLAGNASESDIAALAARPLHDWPECQIALEPLYARPARPPGPGSVLFVPANPGSLRLLLTLFCDFLGRAGVDPAGAQPPIVPALGEAGNALLRRLWAQPSSDAALPGFVAQLRDLFQPHAAGDYHPQPADLSGIELPPALLPLGETLAEHIHDTWAAQRLREGWRFGPTRDDARREHPGLVPYAALTETEKEYDRATATATLKAILALGFRIEPPPAA